MALRKGRRADEAEADSDAGPRVKRVPRVLGAGAAVTEADEVVAGAGAAVRGAAAVTGAVVLGAKVAVPEAMTASQGLELGGGCRLADGFGA